MSCLRTLFRKEIHDTEDADGARNASNVNEDSSYPDAKTTAPETSIQGKVATERQKPERARSKACQESITLRQKNKKIPVITIKQTKKAKTQASQPLKMKIKWKTKTPNTSKAPKSSS